MRYKSFENKSKRYSEAGMTVMELLVAMSIFLIVLSSVYGVLRIGNISRNNINDRSETIKNARLALNSIGRDAVNAGLGYTRVGGLVPDNFANKLIKTPAGSDTNRDLLTGIITGNNIKESDLSKTGEKNDVVAFAFRDLYFNGGNSIQVTNSSKSADSIVLTTSPDGCANCKTYDLYLIESADGKQALAMATDVPTSSSMTITKDDPLKINQPAPVAGNIVVAGISIPNPLGAVGTNETSMLTKCTGSQTTHCFNYSSPATAKKIFFVSYSVDVDGTLVRTSYGNNTGGTAADQIQKQPLAFGIQSFQLRYLMEDGTVTEDPSAGGTNQSNLNNIVQIEVSITVKAESNENGIIQTELINLTSTFSTRNLKYDVE